MPIEVIPEVQWKPTVDAIDPTKSRLLITENDGDIAFLKMNATNYGEKVYVPMRMMSPCGCSAERRSKRTSTEADWHSIGRGNPKRRQVVALQSTSALMECSDLSELWICLGL
jgi:hypothetical protein